MNARKNITNIKYDSGYSEAHERTQSRYDGYPWENTILNQIRTLEFLK